MLISIDEVDKKYTPSDNKKDGLTAGLHEVGGAKANTRDIIGMAKGSSVYTQQYD